MTDLQRYIVEEWAEDYRAGRLARREFLRRMALMAGGATLAVSVLHALGIAASADEVGDAASEGSALTAQATGVTVPPDDPAIQTTTVRYTASAGGASLAGLGYLAQPRAAGPHPAVIVIHENRGMLEHFRDIARRLARQGYAGLAVDLAAPEGGTERFADLAQVSAYLGRTPPDRHVALLNGAYEALRGIATIRADRVGTMGFCFGGGMVWRFATQNPNLRAAVPFYGSNPPLEDVPRIRAAVLAIYGEQDTRINQGIPAIREAMTRANVTHEIVVYPNADHAFFNDTGQRYNRQAAEDAWRRTLAWFQRFLRS